MSDIGWQLFDRTTHAAGRAARQAEHGRIYVTDDYDLDILAIGDAVGAAVEGLT